MAGLARNPCVDVAGNKCASRMLRREVANLRGFFGRFAPELLHPEVVLTGRFERKAGAVDVGGVMREIDDARAEEAARRVRAVG